MTTPILSILTPAVPSRLDQLATLCDEIARQIGDQPVEHLVLLDNKKRTVGEKRDALLRMARGQYVAFVDDDDDISLDYVARILAAAETRPDVITFKQHAKVNDDEAIIEFKLGNQNAPFDGAPRWQKIEGKWKEILAERPVIKRNAWHICAWSRRLAIMSHFPASNYGEDWSFAAPLCALPNLREVHIPEVLHFYNHSTATTEAPPPA